MPEKLGVTPSDLQEILDSLRSSFEKNIRNYRAESSRINYTVSNMSEIHPDDQNTEIVEPSKHNFRGTTVPSLFPQQRPEGASSILPENDIDAALQILKKNNNTQKKHISTEAQNVIRQDRLKHAQRKLNTINRLRSEGRPLDLDQEEAVRKEYDNAFWAAKGFPGTEENSDQETTKTDAVDLDLNQTQPNTRPHIPTGEKVQTNISSYSDHDKLTNEVSIHEVLDYKPNEDWAETKTGSGKYRYYPRPKYSNGQLVENRLIDKAGMKAKAARDMRNILHTVFRKNPKFDNQNYKINTAYTEGFRRNPDINGPHISSEKEIEDQLKETRSKYLINRIKAAPRKVAQAIWSKVPSLRKSGQQEVIAQTEVSEKTQPNKTLNEKDSNKPKTVNIAVTDESDLDYYTKDTPLPKKPESLQNYEDELLSDSSIPGEFLDEDLSEIKNTEDYRKMIDSLESNGVHSFNLSEDDVQLEMQTILSGVINRLSKTKGRFESTKADIINETAESGRIHINTQMNLSQPRNISLPVNFDLLGNSESEGRLFLKPQSLSIGGGYPEIIKSDLRSTPTVYRIQRELQTFLSSLNDTYLEVFQALLRPENIKLKNVGLSIQGQSLVITLQSNQKSETNG